MKVKEAIKEIEYLIGDGVVLEHIVVDLPQESIEALKVAIKACEKQIAKKVVIYSDDESADVYCPNCNKCIGHNEMVYDDFYYRGWIPMYCQECGQAIIW